MSSEWQGTVVPPYEADALPLVSPFTGEPTGNFRPLVLGAEVVLWDGGRGRSRVSGGICTTRAAAVAEAEQWIHLHTDGLLDPALFAEAAS